MEIVEVSPRDGLQNESTILTAAQKIELIERALTAGVRRLEAVSFVRPDAVPQLADAEAVMAQVPRRADVTYIGLVLNRRGLTRAVDAGVDEVNVVLAASETFNRRNQNAGTEQLVDMVKEVVSDARDAGLTTTVTVATAFGCPFEGVVPPESVAELAARVIGPDVDEIALADTIGVGVPRQVRELVELIRPLTDSTLRLHFHNTRNTGYANAMAGLEAGVTVLDASIGGVGGCPFAPRATGNIATEDLVYSSGLTLPELLETSSYLAEQLGKQVPSLVSKAGDFPG
jgi:hydroxymethylglutaryl-CoA lyase